MIGDLTSIDMECLIVIAAVLLALSTAYIPCRDWQAEKVSVLPASVAVFLTAELI
jgi:hypothetical protein